MIVAADGVADDLRSALAPTSVVVRPAGTSGSPAAPDVVVVDLERAAGVDAAWPGVPVLALVGRDSSSDVAAAFAAGATDVLALPLEPSVVAARVAMAARLAAAEGGQVSRAAELTAWADRASHDLRTPLAVISGMAETLEAAWDRLAVDDRARMLGSIRNQAAKAMAMVDEAVSLARGAPDQRS
jgi:signal transduction histidine kinase